MRSVAAGRLRVGFLLSAGLLAAAQSCTSDVPNCTAANCNGCCDPAAGCVAVSKQGFSSCGIQGNACRACVPGQFCGNGTCTLANFDAGGTQDSGTQGQDSGNTVCGFQSYPCCNTLTPCLPGLACAAGVCQPVSDGGQDSGTVGTLAVGSACTSSGQCAAGTCATTGFSGGYCTRACLSNGDCPQGSACGQDPGSTTGGHVCLASCTPAGAAGGCRTSYVCDNHGTTLDGTAVCFPGCTSPATCGAATQCDTRGFCCGVASYACCDGTTCGSGSVCGADGYCHPGTTKNPTGGACTQNTDCTGSLCVPATTLAGTACANTCWVGGYCSQSCGTCAGGSSCTPYLSYMGSTICLEDCAYDGGQGGCRPGYVCDRDWVASGLFSQASCVYACAQDQDCYPSDGGTTGRCVNGFCCGQRNIACCGGGGGTCDFSGSCAADGYCR